MSPLPPDYDDEMSAIITAVRAYSMTSPDKLHALIEATRYVARHGILGDIVEFGVWRGGSMHAVARTLDALGVHDRELYLYDTFEGMTEPTENDVRYDGVSAAEQYIAADGTMKPVCYASLEDVRTGFESVPYPGERLHFVKGRVEDTIPAELPERIAILRLDTDWYDSTTHEFNHAYDRLVSGGVLMIDDYGHWQGSRRATDEFLERTRARLLMIRMGSGRVAVKP